MRNSSLRVIQVDSIGDAIIDFDYNTVTNNAAPVRITARNLGGIEKETLLSGEVSGPIVEARKAFFRKWYKNRIRIVHLDWLGDFGQPVEITAKVDLNGMDIQNLCFYSYDKASNSYRQIEKPAYWVDANGFLHFTTEYAGDIVVSKGLLQKK